MTKKKRTYQKKQGKITYYRCGDRECVEITPPIKTESMKLSPNIAVQSDSEIDSSVLVEEIKKVLGQAMKEKR